MGKEADFNAHAVSPRHEINRKLGYMGLMNAPRTPLRTLITRESGPLWTLEPTDPALLKSPAGKPVESGSGRLNPLDAKTGRIGSLVKSRSPSPPSGSSSSKTFGTRMGQVPHKIRVFKKAGMMRSISQPAQQPVQLGALFAQEREDTHRMAIEPRVQRLRDLIAAEVVSSCAAQREGMQVYNHSVLNARNLKSPPPRKMEATKPVLALDESPELRDLFAKDWASQTSDEEDEFWDSGSLRGARMASPSCHDERRRRSRCYGNEKLSSSSYPTLEPEIEIVGMQGLHVRRHRRDFCRFLDEFPNAVTCGDPKSSLGTLLVEEIATSSGSPLAEPSWSVPVVEGSKRVKIGSLSDISVPVRPESQSQLDFLISKILSLRANSVAGNAELIMTRLPGEDGGGCPSSGSMQILTDLTVREELNETFLIGVIDAADTANATDVNLSMVDASDILLINPPSAEIRQASTSMQDLVTSTSIVVETPVTVSDVGVAETRDGCGEAATLRSNPFSEDVEAILRMQRGSFLERTWGKHGWPSLGRSRMGCPLPFIYQPSSSSTSRFNCENSPRAVPSGPSSLSSSERALPPEAETFEVVRRADAISTRERRPTRVSLLSLLNQDIETDEERLQAYVGECRDDEGEVVTEELDPMCCVCMVGHKGAAFIPCGHAFCRKCCREVRRSIGSCPLCNRAIVDVLKLY